MFRWFIFLFVSIIRKPNPKYPNCPSEQENCSSEELTEIKSEHYLGLVFVVLGYLKENHKVVNCKIEIILKYVYFIQHF